MKMKDRKQYGYDNVRNGFKTITFIVIGILVLAVLTALGSQDCKINFTYYLLRVWED